MQGKQLCGTGVNLLFLDTVHPPQNVPMWCLFVQTDPANKCMRTLMVNVKGKNDVHDSVAELRKRTYFIISMTFSKSTQIVLISSPNKVVFLPEVLF